MSNLSYFPRFYRYIDTIIVINKKKKIVAEKNPHITIDVVSDEIRKNTNNTSLVIDGRKSKYIELVRFRKFKYTRVVYLKKDLMNRLRISHKFHQPSFSYKAIIDSNLKSMPDIYTRAHTEIR